MIMKPLSILLLLLICTASTLAQPAMDTAFTQAVGPGCVLTKFVSSSPAMTAYVLKVDLTNPFLSLETVKAQDRLIGTERTSSMAARVSYEHHRVVAAVNGDFYSTASSTLGYPQSFQVRRGEIVRTSSTHAVLGFDSANHGMIGIVTYSGSVAHGEASWPIDGINQSRGADKLVLFNSYFGSSTGTDPNGVEVVLRPVADWIVNRSLPAIVENVIDGSGNSSLAPGKAILSGNGAARNFLIANLTIGDTASVTLSAFPALADIKEMVGGRPKIVQNGLDYVDQGYADEGGPPGSSTVPNPRTAAGFTADGSTLFLVAVDGRQPALSVGMTMYELAGFLIRLGVDTGINLDGGGSTTMLINGSVVNSPSDGTERAVGNCLVVLSKLGPETRSITHVNTDVSFPNSNASVNFSVLPDGGGSLTITRHEAQPEAPPTFPQPPAGAGYVPLWCEISSTMLPNSFVGSVTLDVGSVAGFGPNTHLLVYPTGASAWLPMPGLYNAEDHSFTFETQHFGSFGFANPSGSAYALYVDTAPAETLANTIYPDTSWGAPTSYEPDWTWENSPPVTVYLAPQPGSVFGLCDLTVEWDSTVMDLNAITWGSAGNPNGLFGSGHTYPVAAYTQLGNSGRVTLNCSRLDNTNFTTAPGDHIAALHFTLLRPGYSPVSVVGCDVRAYVPDQPPAGVFITPYIGQVKAYLGDVARGGSESTGDGKIDFEDLVLWSYSYWSGVPGYAPGMQYYKVKYDIGPTHNGLTTSLPVVDGQINFEDLIIFSIAYGLSNECHLPKAAIMEKQEITITTAPPMVSNEETRIPVMLSGNVQDVRAVSLTATGTFGNFLGAEKGALLQSYSTPVIVMSNSSNGRVQVDLAVAGLNAKALATEGELVVLRFGGTGSVAVSHAEARTSANAPLMVSVGGPGSKTPEVCALEQNYPNPFNPKTGIRYSVSTGSREGQVSGGSDVKLTVFDLLGREVAVLVNEKKLAGNYQATFDGSGLASGMYIYRLRVGSFVESRTMLLIR